MAVREGRWDCQYCGTIGVLGRHKACPVCGAGRPLNTKFYLPKDAKVVEDAELVGYAQKGPDWVCDACGASNPADVRICNTCQAERGSSQSQQVIGYALGETQRSGDMDFSEPEPRPRAAAVATIAPSDGGLSSRTIGLGLAGFLLVVCGILAAISFFGAENKSVTIAQFQWERTVEVEELQTITESDWDLPPDARLLSQSEEIRSYNKVQIGSESRTREVSEQVQVGSRDYKCGERDLGNGFFEDVMCSEPVYETQYRTETYDEPIYEDVPIFDTKYTYEVDRWVVIRTAEAAENTHDPYWPELGLTSDNQRGGERTEKYNIIFLANDGELYDMKFELNEWLTFEPNGRYELEVSGLGVPQQIIR